MSEEKQQTMKRAALSRDEEIQEMKDLIIHLQSQITRLTNAGEETPAELNRRSWLADKTRRKLLDQDRLRQEADENLRAGKCQFEVSLTGEPRMTRVVGVSQMGPVGEAEAQFKFQRYFGIIAILDPDKAFTVKPVEVAAVA